MKWTHAQERVSPQVVGSSPNPGAKNVQVRYLDDSKLEPQGDDEIGRTSLHDAESKMRDTSALDHPRTLQVDRAGP